MVLVECLGSVRLLAEDRTEQSGSYMNGVWKTAIKALKQAHCMPEHITFLGVGMGGGLLLCAQAFPKAKILGIDWDEHLLALAEKNIKQRSLEQSITLRHQRAEDWAQETPHTDLLCIDLFTGTSVAPCVRDASWQHQVAQKTSWIAWNIFTHKDLLTTSNFETFAKAFSATYYLSTIGIYGPADLRS